MLDASTGVAVEALLPLLQRFVRGEYGIAVGGAHAKGTADAESDLDLYVFTEAVLPDDERTELATRFSGDVRDVVSWNYRTPDTEADKEHGASSHSAPFEQAGTDFWLKDLKVECWLRNRALMDRAISECVEGIVRRDLVTWTTTGFYNHCCLSDLKAMIVVDDPNGMLAHWKEQIRVYPPKLREAIVAQHLGAAQFWPFNFHYRSAIERRDVIYTTGIVQQVVHNLIQALFAVNEVYFPGDKKLAEAIAHLSETPHAFAERVESLLCPAQEASVEALRAQQRSLQALLKEVEAIAARD
jgi:hypothetical protein